MPNITETIELTYEEYEKMTKLQKMSKMSIKEIINTAVKDTIRNGNIYIL
jgi:hypothetical protein